jgi:hypothetical protein
VFLLILPVILVTFISIGLFIFVLNFTSPQNPDGSLILINLAYFFGAGFFSLAGFVTLVLYFVGNWRLKRMRRTEVESIHKPRLLLRTSLRHGFLIAGTIMGIGLINALGFSNPLNIVLLISAAVLIEVYFFGH